MLLPRISLDIQVALLARLTALHTRETISGWTHALVSPAQTSQHPERQHRVCWPTVSNSDERCVSEVLLVCIRASAGAIAVTLTLIRFVLASTKRSTLDDVRLSSSSGSLHSAFSASTPSSSSVSSSTAVAGTAPSARHVDRMDADDPNRTLTSDDLVELLAHEDDGDDKAPAALATAQHATHAAPDERSGLARD